MHRPVACPPAYAAALFLAAGASLLAARPARACGGTFCDGGPTPMPVPQTGETVLFVLDEDHVEAHIQIRYDPATQANQFAWLVPMTAVPEFSVGSDALFQALQTATTPTINVSATYACEDDSGGVSFITEPDAGSSSLACDPVVQDCPDGETCVYVTPTETKCSPAKSQTTVGAFEVAVLQSTNVDNVMTWLGDNGYQQDPAARPIIAEYLTEGFLFAAFKLRPNAGVGEIHPVVLRYEGREPCVPIRLTRIAATDDLDVTVFFLDNVRVAPKGYRHVLVNPLKIDWLQSGSNYREVVTMAVDAPGADGHAFVTEHAGPSGVVDRTTVFQARWAAANFVGLSPSQAIDELAKRGLLNCASGFCQTGHALVMGLANQFLRVPDGVAAADFYECPSCFADRIDTAAWDDVAFARSFEERIVQPGLHALELLESWPYLTRLYTTISPHEMTRDPMFAPHPSLPGVNSQMTSQQTTYCNGDTEVTLPDGRKVFIPRGSGWPAFDEEMPWEEDIHDIPPEGALLTLTDNSAAINGQLAAWNLAHPIDRSVMTPDTTTFGPAGESGDTATGTSTGSPPRSTGDAPVQDTTRFDDATASCACRPATGFFGAVGWWPALAAAWGLRRRSRAPGSIA